MKIETIGSSLKPSSWPKSVVRKWLNNIKNNNNEEEFHSDRHLLRPRGVVSRTDGRRKSCSDRECYVFIPNDLSGWLCEVGDGHKRAKVELPHTTTHTTSETNGGNLNHRMFVGTWNVGGKPPHDGLSLKEWLKPSSHDGHTSPAADIYVLGFQEIVPLNAGNVLGAEPKGPAAKWLSLIRKTLNGDDKNFDHSTMEEASNDDQMEDDEFSSNIHDRLMMNSDCCPSTTSSTPPTTTATGGRRCMSFGRSRCNCKIGPVHQLSKDSRRKSQNQYCLAASKQMVGIFLCVWVRSDLYQHVTDLRVSSVGTGIMGYLGNKGSVSISMRLHRKSLCFVCTHLTSGEKEGDEVKRNSDVVEILKRTKFSSRTSSSSSSSSSNSDSTPPPETILEHDNVIWLGDLNYRLATTTTTGSSSPDTFELLEKRDWDTLLDKDQLGIEQRSGRVFEGWEEGRISFAPTYKYIVNSDDYVTTTSSSTTNSKEKRRTPAWCDRILWKGDGLKQLEYSRAELRFSDHRPVYANFTLRVGNESARVVNRDIDCCCVNRSAAVDANSSSGAAACIPALSTAAAAVVAVSAACNNATTSRVQIQGDQPFLAAGTTVPELAAA